MDLNRVIAKKVDLLQFDKPEKDLSAKRKEPQNYIFDYGLVGIIVVLSILLVIYVVAGFIL